MYFLFDVVVGEYNMFIIFICLDQAWFIQKTIGYREMKVVDLSEKYQLYVVQMKSADVPIVNVVPRVRVM